MTGNSAEQSSGDVVAAGLGLTGTRIRRALAGRLHVVKKLPIAISAICTALIAGIVSGTGGTEVSAIEALGNERIPTPAIARTTWSPRWAFGLSCRVCPQANDHNQRCHSQQSHLAPRKKRLIRNQWNCPIQNPRQRANRVRSPLVAIFRLLRIQDGISASFSELHLNFSEFCRFGGSQNC